MPLCPKARSSRLASGRGWPANPRRRISGSGSRVFPAPLASNIISRQEASTGKVSDTRGTNGATWASGTPVTQRLGFALCRIPGEITTRYGHPARRPASPDRTAGGRDRVDRRHRTLSARARNVARLRQGSRCRLQSDETLAGGAQRSRKALRAIAQLLWGSVAGTNRSSPMNQCTRSHGTRLRQASVASNSNICFGLDPPKDRSRGDGRWRRSWRSAVPRRSSPGRPGRP